MVWIYFKVDMEVLTVWHCAKAPSRYTEWRGKEGEGNLICIKALMIINSPEVYSTEQLFGHEENNHGNCNLLYKFILHRAAYECT